mmetsp:Transcript_92393/g.258175  ORF Transcript_92393/g.258175 Transcript_92393/m.258175 type:complete len:232 (-) Transcript_92393:2-697(-)
MEDDPRRELEAEEAKQRLLHIEPSGGFDLQLHAHDHGVDADADATRPLEPTRVHPRHLDARGGGVLVAGGQVHQVLQGPLPHSELEGAHPRHRAGDTVRVLVVQVALDQRVAVIVAATEAQAARPWSRCAAGVLRNGRGIASGPGQQEAWQEAGGVEPAGPAISGPVVLVPLPLVGLCEALHGGRNCRCRWAAVRGAPAPNVGVRASRVATAAAMARAQRRPLPPESPATP